jgi:hypothetical protein
MHEKEYEKARDRDREAEREAVVAADDTGMLQQQELLHEVEIEGEPERSRKRTQTRFTRISKNWSPRNIGSSRRATPASSQPPIGNALPT